VLADRKLSMTTNVGLMPRRPTTSCAASQALWPAGRRRGFCPAALVRPPPGVTCPALEPSAQGRPGLVGADPEEGHKDDPRAGAPLL